MSRAGRPHGDAPASTCPSAPRPRPVSDTLPPSEADDRLEALRAAGRRDRRMGAVQFLLGIVLLSLALYSWAQGSAWFVSVLFAVVALADLLLAVRRLRRSVQPQA